MGLLVAAVRSILGFPGDCDIAADCNALAGEMGICPSHMVRLHWIHDVAKSTLGKREGDRIWRGKYARAMMILRLAEELAVSISMSAPMPADRR
ncbi:hypothetical protein B5V01_35950 [Mesorhizobium erdmanii]|uniref:Uncharacterized protein n=2 Tax=Mesorhizobium TaxID=68287 RepID=A0A3M9X0D1_9HYPH|nr:hypothetical protein DNR46_33980 [Mesorhizobium japonicum]RXT33398.1 hypothetical protein B5V01_35950 [Mesorhizobium erdmanii]